MSAEQIVRKHSGLAKGVFDILSLCKDLELPGKVPNLDDDRIIAAYVAALAANGIEVSILKLATGALMSDIEFFPSPATIVKACLPYRDRALEMRREIVWANPKLIEDEYGNLTAVIGERALPRLANEIEVPIADLVRRMAMKPMPSKPLPGRRDFEPIPYDEDEERTKRALIGVLRSETDERK